MSTLTLTSRYELPLSGRYINPSEENSVLPTIYGNTGENSGSNGITYCPQIDFINHVYCLAGHAILPESDGGYVRLFDSDGDEIPQSFFTVVASEDYESQGTIAYARFASDQGKITAQMKGKVNANGELITNPLDVIDDLILSVGTNVNQSVFAKAHDTADLLGYTCAGAIVSDNTYAFWLNQICSTFLADWWINAEGDLMIRLDTSVSQTSYNPSAYLRQRETTQITGQQSIKNLINQIPVQYSISYTESDKRFKEGVRSNYLYENDGESTKNIQSQFRYGIRTPAKPMTLDWTRNEDTVLAIQGRIIEKFSNPFWLVTWTTQTWESIVAEKGDFVVYSWEDQRDPAGNALQNQFAQVMEQTINLDNGSITYTLRDTGAFFAGYPVTYDGSRDAGDGGVFGGERSTIQF